jgi:hypothetical protein
MVAGVEIEIWIFAQALMARPNAGCQEAGSPKEGYWAMPWMWGDGGKGGKG